MKSAAFVLSKCVTALLLMHSLPVLAGFLSDRGHIATDSLVLHYVEAGLDQESGKLVADSLMKLGAAENDCILSSAGFGLLSHFGTITSGQISSALPPCPLLGFQAPYLVGARLRTLKKCKTAASWFDLSLRNATSSSDKAQALCAIAACCSSVGNPICALESYEQAFAYAEIDDIPLDAIIQFARVQLDLGLSEEALDVIEDGLERDNLSIADELALRLNRLTAYTDLEEFDAARNDVDWVLHQVAVPDKEMDAQTFESLVHWSLMQADARPYLEIRELLNTSSERLDLHELYASDNPARLLFPPFDDEWATFEIDDVHDARWKTIRALYANDRAETSSAAQAMLSTSDAHSQDGVILELPSNLFNFASRWGLEVALSALLMMSALALLHHRKRKQSDGPKSDLGPTDWSQMTMEDRVERLLKFAQTESEEQMLTDIRQSLQSGQFQKVCRIIEAKISHRYGLNQRESEGLVFFVLGHNGAVLAQVMDCSVGYVYNLRSTLRKKLGISREVDFEVWFKNLA